MGDSLATSICVQTGADVVVETYSEDTESHNGMLSDPEGVQASHAAELITGFAGNSDLGFEIEPEP